MVTGLHGPSVQTSESKQLMLVLMSVLALALMVSNGPPEKKHTLGTMLVMKRKGSGHTTVSPAGWQSCWRYCW